MSTKTLKKKTTDKYDKDLLKASDTLMKEAVKTLAELNVAIKAAERLLKVKDKILEVNELIPEVEKELMESMKRKEMAEIVRKMVREELLKLTIKLTPYVSNEEMQEIEKTLSDDDLSDSDFVDGMKWLGR
jgi:dihydroorotate dehydrogenase